MPYHAANIPPQAMVRKLIRSPVRTNMIMLVKDRPPTMDAYFGLAPIANAIMMVKAGKSTLDRQLPDTKSSKGQDKRPLFCPSMIISAIKIPGI